MLLQDGHIGQRGPGWKFAGERVCLEAFVRITGLSKRSVKRFAQHAANGHLEAPPDLRQDRPIRDNPKKDHARAFFTYLYTHLAEPLAEGEAEPEEENPEDAGVLDEFAYFFSRHEAAEHPVAAAAAVMEQGLPQKCHS